MNNKNRKYLLVYLAVMLVLVILSRLYWILGDDPIGLIIVFFYFAPLISFGFALILGNAGRWWLFPFIAGAANVFNYCCNSMMTVNLKPDTGTLWVFGISFAASLAGILLIKLLGLLTGKKKS